MLTDLFLLPIIWRWVGAQTSDTDSVFFLNAQVYSVSHIDGCGGFNTLVDLSDLYIAPASDAWKCRIWRWVCTQTSDDGSGFFLNAQVYSVSHIDGECTSLLPRVLKLVILRLYVTQVLTRHCHIQTRHRLFKRVNNSAGVYYHWVLRETSPSWRKTHTPSLSNLCLRRRRFSHRTVASSESCWRWWIWFPAEACPSGVCRIASALFATLCFVYYPLVKHSVVHSSRSEYI